MVRAGDTATRLSLAGKLAAIAAIAALAAWLPPAVLVGWGIDANLRLPLAVNLLVVAMAGSFVLGLPVAAMFIAIAGRTFDGGLAGLLGLGAATGLVLLVMTGALGGQFGALFLGGPAFIAAMVYAVLGWFWILKPGATASRAPLAEVAP